MSAGIKRVQQGGSRREEKRKERQGERLKVHGISYNSCECHILWASAVFFGGGFDHLALLFLSASFVIHILIPHSTFGQFFSIKV